MSLKLLGQGVPQNNTKDGKALCIHVQLYDNNIIAYLYTDSKFKGC